MKKLSNLDAKIVPIPGEDDPKYKEDAPNMPSVRDVLRMIGNTKMETADDSRRLRRIIISLKDKAAKDLVLENEDHAFLQKQFEKNAVNLTGWFQGQVLDFLDSAEKIDPPKKD